MSQPSAEPPAGLQPPTAPVPVFQCHVYVARPDAAGAVTARMATVADLAATGRSEPEALRRLIEAFKALARDHLERGAALAWLPSPLDRHADEQERFLAVHL